MRTITVGTPMDLDQLTLGESADPGQPGAGEIRVALHGSSLNFHDLGVVDRAGWPRPQTAAFPLADGAGVG